MKLIIGDLYLTFDFNTFSYLLLRDLGYRYYYCIEFSYQLKENNDYICILCSIHTFRYYFSNHIDITLLKKHAVLQSAIFSLKARTAIYLVNGYIYPFLAHIQCSQYFWHDNSFKVLQFLQFLFPAHCIYLFYHLFERGDIISWHWHIY